jgi:hypothetical protein
MCVWHGDPERAKAYASEIGSRGRAMQTAAKEAAVADLAPRPLRTHDDMITALEGALAVVEASGADAVKRAAAICKIVETAHGIIRGELERDARRMAEILDAHPELARHVAEVKALEQ